MYIITDNSILRDDGACIPIDLGNADYRVFLEWQLQGGIPTIFNPFPIAKSNEIAAFKANRDSMIDQLAGIAIAANASGDTVTFNGAVAARQSIIDIITQPSIVAAATLQDLRSAIAAERLKIIQAMPVTLKQILSKLN